MPRAKARRTRAESMAGSLAAGACRSPRARGRHGLPASRPKCHTRARRPRRWRDCFRRSRHTVAALPHSGSVVDLKIAMTSIRWCAVAVALASAAGGWGQAQCWGERKGGKYAVGFGSLYQLDGARRYDADYPAPGGTPVKKPRPIFLAIWYPAAAREDEQMDTSMVYRDYFRAAAGY